MKKNNILDFLSVSSAERRGVILLIIIILILSSLQAYMVFHSRREISIADSLLMEIESFEKHVALLNEERTSRSAPVEIIAGSEPLPELIEPGLFRRVPSGKLSTTSGQGYKNISAGDINLADSALLEGLRGIGPVLARRIIRYRSLLGGFYKTKQLQEVYGLPDSLVESVSLRFYADTATIKKININDAAEWEMARHPYLGKHIAKGIIKYRESAGKIVSVEELKSNGLLDDEQFEKVKNYLSI